MIPLRDSSKVFTSQPTLTKDNGSKRKVVKGSTVLFFLLLHNKIWAGWKVIPLQIERRLESLSNQCGIDFGRRLRNAGSGERKWYKNHRLLGRHPRIKAVEVTVKVRLADFFWLSSMDYFTGYIFSIHRSVFQRVYNKQRPNCENDHPVGRMSLSKKSGQEKVNLKLLSF